MKTAYHGHGDEQQYHTDDAGRPSPVTSGQVRSATHHGYGDEQQDDTDYPRGAGPVVGQACQDAAYNASHVEQGRQVG